MAQQEKANRARSVRCVLMRGGTSKAVFLDETSLPTDPAARDELILALFGSPDRRQIDGMGGADPLTSKLAIIGAPGKAGAHLTYTFGQVEIDTPSIDYHSLCGNISAAVGAYAVYEKLVDVIEPITKVRVYNSNLKRMLLIEVPVAGRLPIEAGDYSVPGVPGTGARILIDFSDTAGAATGGLLPTGSAVDRLDVPGHGSIDASLIDIGNAHVFIRARDVGLAGTETAGEIDNNPALLDLLERIRGAAAHRIGMVSDPGRARYETPATPLLAMVSPPARYLNVLENREVEAEQIDLVSRLMFMQTTHKTYAGTSTVCTGVASRIPGTLVHEVSRPTAAGSAGSAGSIECRIGHPAGVIVTEVALISDDRGFTVERATLGRTARRIFEGQAFVPDRIRFSIP